MFISLQQHTEEAKDATIKKDDVAFYENTYLTLNRKCHISSNNVFCPIYCYVNIEIPGDYDQCSDDDGDPVMQDTKGMSMQEVELMTMRTSDENSPRQEEDPLQVKYIQPISTRCKI